MNKSKVKKKKTPRLYNAIDKATFAMRGMIHIPTVRAIEYFYKNPKKYYEQR